jgi:Phage tail lysozyme
MSLAVVARRSLAAVGLAVAVVGCGTGPGEPLGQTASAITGFPNDQTAFDYFLGKGLANFQAAGIVGNLDQESGVDPTAVEAGGPGRGIAQWSVGGRWDTDANDNAEWYATQQGQSVDSLQLQLDFIWYELTTFPGYGLAALQQSTNVTDATVAFQNDFEGCGTCDQSTRIAYAENVLSEFGNDKVDGGGSTSDAGSGETTCTVPGVGSGVCILTSACAAMPGYVSTPNYCPGPADIECCTGPSEDGGTKTGSDSGTGSSGSSSGGSAGSSSGGSSGGLSGGSSGGAGAPDGSTASANGDASADTHGSGGCTTAGGSTGSFAGYGLIALVWLASVIRRARPVKS